MPRICASNNDPIDYCQKCYPDEQTAFDEFGDIGDGPDGRGNCFCMDPEHPDYDDCDYRCHDCGRRLANLDNFPKE